MIKITFRRLGRIDIASPTALELVGLALVLAFLVIVATLWH